MPAEHPIESPGLCAPAVSQRQVPAHPGDRTTAEGRTGSHCTRAAPRPSATWALDWCGATGNPGTLVLALVPAVAPSNSWWAASAILLAMRRPCALLNCDMLTFTLLLVTRGGWLLLGIPYKLTELTSNAPCSCNHLCQDATSVYAVRSGSPAAAFPTWYGGRWCAESMRASSLAARIAIGVKHPHRRHRRLRAFKHAHMSKFIYP